jgi:hypothetical protein
VGNFWLLSGSVGNWTHTIKESEHLWATRDTPNLRPVVQRVAKGDLLAFYVTRPVAGVVGFGVAECERFTGTTPYWPDEKKARSVLYPHRFKFSILHSLPESLWKTKALRPDELAVRLSIFRSLNTLTEDQFNAMVHACDKKWTTSISSKMQVRGPTLEEKREPTLPAVEEPDHDKIIEMLNEIGRLKRLVVEKEYPIDNLRLDMAWKKVVKGNPHAAFEVQIGGNFFEALTKLKHAWDIWRSIPVLITTDEYADKARQLIEGSFHEIRNQLKIVDFKEIKELYDAWRKIDEIENRITLSQI